MMRWGGNVRSAVAIMQGIDVLYPVDHVPAIEGEFKAIMGTWGMAYSSLTEDSQTPAITGIATSS